MIALIPNMSAAGRSIPALLVGWPAAPSGALGQTRPAIIPRVEMPPLAARVRRLLEAMDDLGEPFNEQPMPEAEVE